MGPTSNTNTIRCHFGSRCFGAVHPIDRFALVMPRTSEVVLSDKVARSIFDLNLSHYPSCGQMFAYKNANLKKRGQWGELLHFDYVPGPSEREQYVGSNTNDAHQVMRKLLDGEADKCLTSTAHEGMSCAVVISTTKCPTTAWTLDSGCAYDLACIEDLNGQEHMFTLADAPQILHTASGPALTDTVIPLTISKLNKSPARPFIMNNTPNVLTMGRCCVEEGFSF